MLWYYSGLLGTIRNYSGLTRDYSATLCPYFVSLRDHSIIILYYFLTIRHYLVVFETIRHYWDTTETTETLLRRHLDFISHH